MTYIVKELLESLNEMRTRSWTPARSIAKQATANTKGAMAHSEDEDPEFHKDEIESLKKAISTNPEYAKLLLPKMQQRLAHHEKRYKELTGDK